MSERVRAAHLVLLEVCTHAPTLVVGERVPVLLEERVDARDASIPRVLQVFKSQTPEERDKSHRGAQVNQSGNQSTNQSISHQVNQSNKQATNKSLNHSDDQSANQSINQSNNQPTNQSINQPTNQSINQSTDLSINDSTNQSTN